MNNGTELNLSFWRNGSTQAERISASILGMLGFENIDPQCPLGGPDGKKDLVAEKAGRRWVGGVYFPNGPVSFSKIKKKMLGDIDRSFENLSGFIFITNQDLSPSQRSSLSKLIEDKHIFGQIVHLQQLVSLLDSPSGYGLRIRFLSIPMTMEEQLSWVNENDSKVLKSVEIARKDILSIKSLLERMNTDQATILTTLSEKRPIPLPQPDIISVSEFVKRDDFESFSSVIFPQTILLFHRLLCFDLPSEMVGVIRNQNIRLGGIDGQIAYHVNPPPPEQIVSKLHELCNNWNERLNIERSRDVDLLEIAQFHSKFLQIHPFLDGNGRVARSIMMQQLLDIFGNADMTLLNKGAKYYEALRAADGDNFDQLVDIIKPIVSI